MRRSFYSIICVGRGGGGGRYSDVFGSSHSVVVNMLLLSCWKSRTRVFPLLLPFYRETNGCNMGDNTEGDTATD